MINKSEYFSTGNNDTSKTSLVSEVDSTKDVSGSLQALQNAQDQNMSELSFWKKMQVMKDVAETRADHYKEMAKIVHQYQQEHFKSELDARLASAGKQIMADTAVRDMAVNQQLAELDEKQKEFFEEYIFNFRTRRMLKYNERVSKLKVMMDSGEISEIQHDEIAVQMSEIKQDIDGSFVDGLKDIMRKNMELRNKVINRD